MPLQVPVLDDRQFTDLVDEARSLIPTYAPEWTNHNPTDPGVTLIELFAHLAEMLIYRMDRVTTANVAAFLNLLDGGTRTPGDLENRDVAAEIRRTILDLRKPDRAVSCADFETLALEADGEKRVARAHCVPRRNLEADLVREKPGHMSVVILPVKGEESSLPQLTSLVKAYLEPRVLLTTRAHVVGAHFLDLAVEVTVVPLADHLETEVKKIVATAITTYLDPHPRRADGGGWPFGRNVFVSELHALIDRLPGVDFVKELSLTPDPSDRLLLHNSGQLIGVSVRPHELVRVQDVKVDAEADDGD